jgi:quercetin dioxygenase-like cupin family protein
MCTRNSAHVLHTSKPGATTTTTWPPATLWICCGFGQTAVVGSGRQLYDPVSGQRLVFMKTGVETGGELLQVEVRLDPGGRVPRHVHLRQDERIEVVAGALVARVGGEDHQLRSGDSLDVHRRRVHVIRNAAEYETRFVLEVRPARHMELTMRSLFGVMRLLARILRRASRPA